MLDYTKNDAWAVGLIAYGMLSPQEQEPFGAQGDVRLYTDGDYQEIPLCYSSVLRDIVRGLLAVDPYNRLSADQAIVRLKGYADQVARLNEERRVHGMLLFIKTLAGKTITLTVSPSDKSDVAFAQFVTQGTPHSRQTIACNAAPKHNSVFRMLRSHWPISMA